MKQLILPALLLVTVLAFGQRGDYTSKVPKAVRLFEAAEQLYDARRDEKALEMITEALQADSTFVEAWLLRAVIYEERDDRHAAMEAYEESLRLRPDYFPNTYATLGRLYYKEARYADAKKSYEKYLTYPSKNPLLRQDAETGLRNCVFADSAMKHPVPFEPVNMGDAINTADEEYFPAITADGNTFLFTRRSKKPNDYGKITQQEDFFVSTRVDKKWTTAVPLSDINTGGNEGAPALSADGRYLFFTACQELGGYPGNKKGYGACDIFLTRKDGNHWGPARNLEPPVNTASWESQPSFSSDGRTLYFVRKVKDQYGHSNSDILVTRIGDDSKWSEPVSVGDNINTTSDEMSVCIHPDDQTLYFSSSGHPGMGGLDIFMSRRRPDGSWGDPVNLGYPINTPADENSLLVAPNGEVAYFASNRPDSRGGLDLYQFPLYAAARPQAITYMKGRVLDAGTRQPLSANFELIDLATGQTVIRSSSDGTTGEFLIALPAGKRYALNASRKDYLFFSESFELTQPSTAAKPFLKDVLMHPVKAGEHIVLKNIFFATDSFRLKPESKVELDKLVAFMNANGGLKIEISGHTDNVGGKEYNQQLSEKRAMSVYDYLVAAGIPGARLTYKGYGDTKPVASNDSEEGRAENRRTEFLVVSLN